MREKRIVLEDPTGDSILDFSYNDRGGWPESPDGAGRSLTLRSLANELENPMAWRSSSLINGSPGFEDNLSYEAWLAIHFSADEIANPEITGTDADPDQDGLENLGEYATGADPKRPDSGAVINVSTQATDDGLRAQLSLRTALAADEVIATPQLSHNLVEWADLGSEGKRDGERIVTAAAGESVDRLWRVDILAQAEEATSFYRFRFER